MPISGSLSEEAILPSLPLGQIPDWGLLHDFLVVSETGSLSAGARRLGTSQPTLTRRMQALENQLRIALFERTSRGLVPTAAGQTLAEHAAQMRAHAAAIGRQMQALESDLAGTVRITASEILSAFVLPEILVNLHRSHPEIDIELVASNEMANLLEREADIAVRMARPEQVDLTTRKVGEMRLGLFAHRAYLDSRGRPDSLESLARHDLIGYDHNDVLIRGFNAAGMNVDGRFFRFRCDNQIVCWQMVQAGFGIGLVSELLTRGRQDMERVLPAAPIPSLPIWLTVHREVKNSRRLRVVFDFLAAALGAL